MHDFEIVPGHFYRAHADRNALIKTLQYGRGIVQFRFNAALFGEVGFGRSKPSRRTVLVARNEGTVAQRREASIRAPEAILRNPMAGDARQRFLQRGDCSSTVVGMDALDPPVSR